MAAWSEGIPGEAAHTHRFENRRQDPGPDPPSLPVGVAGAARYPPSRDRALPRDCHLPDRFAQTEEPAVATTGVVARATGRVPDYDSASADC